MRVLENLKIGKAEKYQVDIFNSLPDRAKELIFATINDFCVNDTGHLQKLCSIGMSDYSECRSPIEKILYVAVDIVYLLRIDEFRDWYFYFMPQHEIEDNGRNYRVDFCLCLEQFDTSYDIVVECDGYQFHQKTKQQVKNDNEREMRLKLLGYDVLRFSGSQIYENPIKCANDILDFALIKISE